MVQRKKHISSQDLTWVLSLLCFVNWMSANQLSNRMQELCRLQLATSWMNYYGFPWQVYGHFWDTCVRVLNTFYLSRYTQNTIQSMPLGHFHNCCSVFSRTFNVQILDWGKVTFCRISKAFSCIQPGRELLLRNACNRSTYWAKRYVTRAVFDFLQQTSTTALENGATRSSFL